MNTNTCFCANLCLSPEVSGQVVAKNLCLTIFKRHYRIMKKLFLYILLASTMSCQSDDKKNDTPIRLITLAPGHFHAALVQKTMYSDVDSVVHVYAPEGNDLKLHLDRIKTYNTRSESPTHWKEEVYTGNDFFEKM